MVGPQLSRKQFVRAIATASFTKTGLQQGYGWAVNWRILGVDADLDDESGKVELRIEAQVECSAAQGTVVSIEGFAFHVT